MKAQQRIEEIEVLRAIAVLAIFVYHAGSLIYSPGEVALAIRTLSLDLAVDLFFVISGFVISRELISSIEEGRLNGSMRKVVYAFWIRRAFRLLPSAWISLAFLIVLSLAYNAYGFARSPLLNTRDALYAMFHLANFHWYQCTWSIAECGANPVYWSLSLEEQFYLLLPLLLVALGRKAPVLFFALCALQIISVRHGWTIFWIIRTDGLLLGVLLAYAHKTEVYSQLLARLTNLRPITWLASIAILFVLPWNPTSTAHWTGVAVLLSGALVFLASGNNNLFFPAGRCRSALAWIGARSYAMYLYHIPANIIALETVSRFSNPERLAAGEYNLILLCSSFGVTILLASINLKFIETPLRRKGKLLSDKVLSSNFRDKASNDLALIRGEAKK